MVEQELIELIEIYEDYIDKGNRLLIEYFQLDIPPIIARNRKLIPHKGTFPSVLGDIDYWFHGSGCDFTFENKIMVPFDYVYEIFEYKGFLIFKFHRFITSYVNSESELKYMEKLKSYLLKLEQKGTLSKNNGQYLGGYEYIYNK